MKHNIFSVPDSAPVASTVTVLRFKGHLHLDPDPLAEIYAARGEVAAEDTVCRTLADIANRIGELELMHMRSAFTEMSHPARRIAAIAGQIGLTELATAASHVATASGQGDGTAVEATFSRLERCFDLAMTEVWNFHAPY